MPQKLFCPKCNKLLIKNWDLVIDDPVVMDMARIKEKNGEIKEIVCHNCKRRLRYFVENTKN